MGILVSLFDTGYIIIFNWHFDHVKLFVRLIISILVWYQFGSLWFIKLFSPGFHSNNISNRIMMTTHLMGLLFYPHILFQDIYLLLFIDHFIYIIFEGRYCFLVIVVSCCLRLHRLVIMLAIRVLTATIPIAHMYYACHTGQLQMT